MLEPVFDPFVKMSPVSVMARGIIERLFNPATLDDWFDRTAESQYTKNLLFSSVFEIMSLVVLGVHGSVHGAIQAKKADIPVSVQSVYNKLDGVETGLSEKLTRFAAKETASVVELLGGMGKPLLPGFRVKIVDGNCIEATVHRIGELRTIAAGPLPGKSLVVYDPSLRIPIDVFLCEDGHAQKRSMLGRVL